MAKKRFLNLDELVAEPGTVVYKGKEYKVPEMTVEQFFRLLQVQQQVDEGDVAGNLEATRKMLMEVVEGMTEEDVKSMTMAQMSALVQFIIEDVLSSTNTEGNLRSLEAVKK